MVDSILARYGMTWLLDPYRIVNKNGVIVQHGPHFDVTEQVLKKQENIQDKRVLFSKPSPSTLEKNKTNETD
jgi:hypothetical protein